MNKIEQFGNNPMHLRTIKLFRWHIAKQESCTLEEVEKVIKEFQTKYDVTGEDFIYPIVIALTKDVIQTDLITLIHTLGKEQVMGLLEDYLKLKNNK